MSLGSLLKTRPSVSRAVAVWDSEEVLTEAVYYSSSNAGKEGRNRRLVLHCGGLAKIEMWEIMSLAYQSIGVGSVNTKQCDGRLRVGSGVVVGGGVCPQGTETGNAGSGAAGGSTQAESKRAR